MSSIFRHIVRCLIAGIVALLPIAGIVVMVVYAEYRIAHYWLARQNWYFPGLGLLAVVVVLYLIGLVVGTVIGQWIWTQVDKLFARLPILGNLYQTLKQILGYGEGPGALFERVVLIPAHEANALEMGLVTNTIHVADGSEQLLVFVPACPNPMTGRLLVIEAARTRPVAMHVNEAMRAFVALGKAGIKNLQPQIGELKDAVSAQSDDNAHGDKDGAE